MSWVFVMGSCCLCFEHNTGHPFLFCFVVNAFSVLKGGCKITDERPIVELPYKGESLRTRAGAAMNNCSIFDGVAILSLSVTVRYVLLKRFGRDSVSCTAAKFQPHRPSYTVFVQWVAHKTEMSSSENCMRIPCFWGPMPAPKSLYYSVWAIAPVFGHSPCAGFQQDTIRTLATAILKGQWATAGSSMA